MQEKCQTRSHNKVSLHYHNHAFSILCQGDSPMDTLRHWQRTDSRALDQDTKQECMATERLLRKALSGGGEAFTSHHSLSSLCLLSILSHITYLPHTVAAAPAPAKPFDALQDSQLFDAENSEPLSSSAGGCPSGGGVPSSQSRPRTNRNSEVTAAPASPKRWQSNGSTRRHRARGTEAAVLYGVMLIYL